MSNQISNMGPARKRKIRAFYGVSHQSVAAQARKLEMTSNEHYESLAIHYDDTMEQSRAIAKDVARRAANYKRTKAGKSEALARNIQANLARVKRKYILNIVAKCKTVYKDNPKPHQREEVITKEIELTDLQYQDIIKKSKIRAKKVEVEDDDCGGGDENEQPEEVDVRDAKSFKKSKTRAKKVKVKVEVEVEDDDCGGGDENEQPEEVDVSDANAEPEGEIKDQIDDAMNDYFNQQEEESPITSSGGDVNSYSVTPIDSNPCSMSSVRARETGALMLDGEATSQPWHKKQGTCVYDYLIHTFGNRQGFKSSMNHESLTEIFKDPEDPLDDPLKMGVNTWAIKRFCVRFNVTMIAYDRDLQVFDSHMVDNGKNGSLLFKLANHHFYPIENPDRKRSLTMKQRIKTECVREHVSKRKSDENNANADISSEVIFVDDVQSSSAYMCSMIEKHQCLPGKIYLDGIIGKCAQSLSIRQFSIGTTLYNVNCDTQMVVDIFKRIGVKYTSQSINQAIFAVIEKNGIKMEKSIMNPEIYHTLTRQGVMDRTHYGVEEQWDELRDDTTCCDISKCHAGALCNSMYPWIITQFNDTWQPYGGDISRLGLYEVDTDDTTLLKQSNIYSTSILVYARSLGIQFTVRRQMLATKSYPREFFKGIVDAFASAAGGDKVAFKKLFQIFSGYLGKSRKTRFHVKIGTGLDEIMIDLHKAAMAPEGKESRIIHQHVGDLNGDDYFLFGRRENTRISETHMPVYIQMLDEVNINLHKMIVAMGGRLAFRKVDCAVVIGGHLPELSDAWGGYRESEKPRTMGVPKRFNDGFVRFEHSTIQEWVDHPFCDSDQHSEIYDAATRGDGMLIKGRAGTGKSYTIGEMCKRLEIDKLSYSKLSPTNVAAININGQTIHKYFGLGFGDSTLSALKLKKISRKKHWFIIDEISMIPSHIWRKLIEVKKSTGCGFILLGDNRQCPPVEEGLAEDFDYFDHPAVKFLTNYNRCELQVPHRYDMDMWNHLENIYEGKPLIKAFGDEFCDINICATNAIRIHVNKLKMKEHVQKKYHWIKDPEHGEDTQEMMVYKGLPVIGRINVYDDDSVEDSKDKPVLVANSERFTVSLVLKDSVTCKGMRQGEEYIVKSTLDQFSLRFLPAYAVTVHKCQSMTIAEPFTLWGFHSMRRKLQYTAFSRAKNDTQINFRTLTPDVSGALAAEYRLKVLTAVIKGKIESHVATDRKAGFQTDVNVQWVLSMLKNQCGECSHCHEPMKTHYAKLDEKQFTIDRLDETIGHTQVNCVIACLRCNSAHASKAIAVAAETDVDADAPVVHPTATLSLMEVLQDGQAKSHVVTSTKPCKKVRLSNDKIIEIASNHKITDLFKYASNFC
jgi:hypothetical protein